VRPETGAVTTVRLAARLPLSAPLAPAVIDAVKSRAVRLVKVPVLISAAPTA